MAKGKPVSLLKRKLASNRADSKSDGGRKRRKSDNPGPSDTPKTHPRALWPVDETYRQASHAVGRLLHTDATGSNGISLKSLTLASHITNKKAVYAITIETLKHLPVLEQLVDRVGEGLLTAGLPRPAAYVLIKELLWSGGGLHPSGPAERSVLDLKVPLQSMLQTILGEADTEDIKDLLPAVRMAAAAANRPRTARVNELKMSIEDALAWIRSPPPQHLHKWGKYSHPSSGVTVDAHLPELLNFPPGADLHDHPLVTNGSLILQSKASCMTARALAPQPGWKVIDACAAPGNKTTHVAALLRSSNSNSNRMTNNPSVIAFDKDSNRLQRLCENSELAGAAAIISPRCADFLSIDPFDEEYADVTAVLLDPSCSGSGTAFSRMEYLLPSAATKAAGADAVAYSDSRVQALAAFQTAALLHALSFPAAQRVAYSTCSLHAAENECVVATVLEQAAVLQQGWQLVTALPQWPRRGATGWQLGDEDAAKVVRTDPVEDGTDGFFVAVFERKQTKKKMKKMNDDVSGVEGGEKKEKKKKAKKEKKNK